MQMPVSLAVLRLLSRLQGKLCDAGEDLTLLGSPGALIASGAIRRLPRGVAGRCWSVGVGGALAGFCSTSVEEYCISADLCSTASVGVTSAGPLVDNLGRGALRLGYSLIDNARCG